MKCSVCDKDSPPYTCPRCNARYCSGACYKQHSDQCVESFSRESAIAELRSAVASEEDQSRMMDILTRLYQTELDDDDEEDSGSDSENEAGGSEQEVAIDLNAPLDKAALAQLGSAIKPWDPWWLSTEAAQLELSATGTRLVALVIDEEEDQGTGIDDGSSILPLPPTSPLPLLSTLTSKPSPTLAYRLMDLLYAYCLAMRLFNGDYTCDPLEAGELVFMVSAVLGPDASAAVEETALIDSVIRTRQRAAVTWSVPRGFAVGLMTDVSKILQLGRYVVITALMDLSRLCAMAAQEVASIVDQGDAGQQRKVKQLQQRLKLAEKKMVFFMSWANEQPHETYDSLALISERQFQQQLRHTGENTTIE